MLHFITFGLTWLGSALGLVSGVQKVPAGYFSAKDAPNSVAPSRADAWIRNPKVQAEDCDSAHRMKPMAVENGTVMGDAGHGSYLLFRQVDLKNVEKLTYRLSAANHPAALELRLDSPMGPVVSTLRYDKTSGWNDFAELTAPVTNSPGVYDLYFVVAKPDEPNTDLLRLDWIYFHRKTTVLPRLGG